MLLVGIDQVLASPRLCRNKQHSGVMDGSIEEGKYWFARINFRFVVVHPFFFFLMEK
jgi:hypothetical protein